MYNSSELVYLDDVSVSLSSLPLHNKGIGLELLWGVLRI